MGKKRTRAEKEFIALRRKDRLEGRVAQPQLGPGEVYITNKGKYQHTMWCTSMNGSWLTGGDGPRVVKKERALGMPVCPNCLAGGSMAEAQLQTELVWE